MSSLLEGYHVVAKWYSAKTPSGQMNVVSRSLGKLSIVDRSYTGEPVKHHDICLCRISRETKPGTNSGVFILTPIRKLDPKTELRKLIPGFYDLRVVGFGQNKAAIAKPNSDGNHFWILSKNTRQIFSNKYYAVVVPIDVSGSVSESPKAD